MGPCSYEYGRWQESNLIQPIDTTKLKHWKEIAASLRSIPGLMKSSTEAWFIPQYWANTSITYRTDLAPEYVGKETYKILFDPKYRGRVAALDGVDDTVTIIAKAVGLDPYNLSAADWEVLQAKLRVFVQQARFITSDESSLVQALSSGEVVAAITWNQTAATLKREGVKVAFMKPAEGMFTYACGLVMNRDTKDIEKSLDLIDSGLSATAARYMVESLNVGPANTTVIRGYTDKQLQDFGLPRDLDSYLKGSNFQIRLKNKDDIERAWYEMRSGSNRR
jgi:spermidine/putrescine transport system substrate-binding protein